MCENPEAVLKRQEQALLRDHRIVLSAITYSLMRLGGSINSTPGQDADRPERPAIAGYTIAIVALLVTNQMREFKRGASLVLKDQVN